MIVTVDLTRIDAAAPSSVAAWARVAPTDPDGIAAVVDQIADSLRDDPGLAAKVLELLLDLLPSLDAEDHRARVCYLLAQARIAEGRLDEALDFIERARRFYAQAGDDLQALRTNLARTHVLFEMGRHDEALEASVEVLSAFSMPVDGLDEAERLNVRGTAHMNVGVCHEYAGRFQAALASFAAAADDFTSVDNHVMLGHLLHNQAWVLIALGKVGDATAMLRRAAAALEREGVRASVAMTQVALVRAHVDMGEPAEALQILESAGDILDEIDAPGVRYDHLTTAAEAYASLNLLREAVDLYRDILKWHTDSGFEVERARASFGLGVALARLGEHVDAIEALERAVATFRSLGHASGLARSLVAMGDVRAREGRGREAAGHLDDAARVALAGGAPAEALQARLALVELEPTDAATVARNHADARELGIAPLVVLAAHAAGRRALHDGDLASARSHLSEAAAIVERQRRSLQHEVLLVGFARDKDGLDHDLVRLELADPASSASAALTVMENAKSRSLRQMATGACRRGGADREPERAELLEADLHAAYRAMFTAAAEDPAAFERLRRRAGELETQLQRIRLAGVGSVRADAPNSAGSGTGGLDPSAGVLSYFCLGPQVVAVVGRGDDLRVVAVAEVAQVLDLLARFAAQRDRLRLGAAFAARHGARLVQSCRNVLGELHDALIAPVLADLQDRPAGELLVVSPHGPLHAVPFHALWGDDRYLIDDRPVAITPSLALEAPGRREAIAGRPLVVGVTDDLAPLAGPEARSVHERIGGDLLYGAAATVDAFVEAAAGRSLIHLATHAWHRSDNPMFSAVRFADRWLTAAEVLERLDLTGAVVVLSACETGRSSTTGGDELLGLVRGFLGAGARQLVASLWPADDAATAELMDQFHLSLATDGVASALRTAQLRTRETFSHPSHWAPFVALGAR